MFRQTKVDASAYRWGWMRLAGSRGFRDEVRWRVFVAYTSELREFPRETSYVAAVERAISAAGHVIVNMVDFAAAGQAPARVCADRVVRRAGTAHAPQALGYQSLNVQTQQRHVGSLLQWTRRMIEIRKRQPVFGTGVYEELTSSNPSVLAFVRLPDSSAGGDSDGSDRILCVNNLSRFPQIVELDLRRFKGVTPVECMGGVTFPRIGELSYLLTLPGHGFYWFQLPAARDDRSSGAASGGIAGSRPKLP
jgi:hypothetical protein